MVPRVKHYQCLLNHIVAPAQHTYIPANLLLNHI